MRAINLKPSSKVTGNSKFGGNPIMPASMKWPTSDYIYEKDENGDFVEDENGEYVTIETPMHFVCQIDLSEFDNDFADTGILYFFFVHDPDEIGDSQVLYYNGNEKLEERRIDQALLEQIQEATEKDYPFEEVGVELDEDEESNTHLFGSGDYLQENLEGYDEEDDDENENSSKTALLLQIDSNDFDQIGDGQMFYFVMPKRDIEKKDFDSAWCEMQYD